MKTQRCGLLLAGLITLGLTTVSHAQSNDPRISIGENRPISWQQALDTGKIVPASNPLSGFAAQEFYNSQIGMMGVERILPADQITLGTHSAVSDGNETHDSLVMSWNLPPADTDLNVAAYDFRYGVDPDLTNTCIYFSVYPPVPNIWDVSVELFDVNGFSRGWFITGPANVWASLCLNTNLGAQGPFNAYFSQPGFDITQVTTIRFNESWMGNMFMGPPNPIDGTILPWNSWNHIEVTICPEPGGFLLFAALSVPCTALLFRRRNKHG
jgi:hypothetical protein